MKRAGSDGKGRAGNDGKGEVVPRALTFLSPPGPRALLNANQLEQNKNEQRSLCGGKSSAADSQRSRLKEQNEMGAC